MKNLKPISSEEKLLINLGTFKVCPASILFIRGEGNYSKIFLKDGRKVLSCRTLKFFEILLQDYGFIRPSKSALVNPDGISSVDLKYDKVIKLTNDVNISISRRQVRPLREFLNSQELVGLS
ncbi:LytR/AlgR family response regulator transcription factor [Aquirufa rosea]|uniref:LytTR family transcriptional regulator n=1 Tax=Aquirufa rosea TaxID=2509241 RepID=A0A4Q1BX87_9BACT|nr:LytTR family DNA-binding domain-containing protein [Aquirufa rosea]RXK46816.1 LytTR family transcriptional regulator [Aquirufa rosea]